MDRKENLLDINLRQFTSIVIDKFIKQEMKLLSNEHNKLAKNKARKLTLILDLHFTKNEVDAYYKDLHCILTKNGFNSDIKTIRGSLWIQISISRKNIDVLHIGNFKEFK